jgi:hypothetical protein
MVAWQIKGLLLLGGALAALTLAAGASATAGPPARVAAERLAYATVVGDGHGTYQPSIAPRSVARNPLTLVL